MPRRERWPAALTIAGSDSSGGAGIQADLKVMTSLKVHGLTAISCLTAQNPDEVRTLKAVTADFLTQQIIAVESFYRLKAVKTGMLYSSTLIRAVVDYFQANPGPKLVVDPVIKSSSGTELLKPSAIKALHNELFPIAEIITPNISEAELLIGHELTSLEDVAEAAVALHQEWGCHVLIKGGHLRTANMAIDILANEDGIKQLKAPRARIRSPHGTGCTYASAIASFLAKGNKTTEAVELSKHYVTQSIHNVYKTEREYCLRQSDPTLSSNP